ncbi:exportin-2-like [Cryptomeria japonica]|uniref:exportin-2-like n=1 Tax=Cryptomeria japonica TaxID=3369 RepID=UPI0025ACC5C9|nr:exportin-2-like [Cryptomeria japonica]
MRDSIMSFLVRPEGERVLEEVEILDLEETVGYTPTFAQLYNAGKKEEDLVTDVKDPKGFRVSSLARISAHAPGKYLGIIQHSLEPANQIALAEFCSTYGFAIVYDGSRSRRMMRVHIQGKKSLIHPVRKSHRLKNGDTTWWHITRDIS